MRGIAHRWMADMNTAKAYGIHLAAVMVASEEGAEKEREPVSGEFSLHARLHDKASRIREDPSLSNSNPSSIVYL